MLCSQREKRQEKKRGGTWAGGANVRTTDSVKDCSEGKRSQRRGRRGAIGRRNYGSNQERLGRRGTVRPATERGRNRQAYPDRGTPRGTSYRGHSQRYRILLSVRELLPGHFRCQSSPPPVALVVMVTSGRVRCLKREREREQPWTVLSHQRLIGLTKHRIVEKPHGGEGERERETLR